MNARRIIAFIFDVALAAAIMLMIDPAGLERSLFTAFVATVCASTIRRFISEHVSVTIERG